MTTKSNLNPLVIIIIIALSLFVIALIWKNYHVDNSEQINLPKQETIKETKLTKKITIKDNSNPNFKLSELDPDRVITADDRKLFQESVSETLNTALMLNTPEKLMERIIYFQGKGDEDKANQLIDSLLTRFPDYEMEN